MQNKNLLELFSQEHFQDIKYYKNPVNWVENGFIITATSSRHISSFFNKAKKMRLIKKNDVEGSAKSEWMILEIDEALIHIFTQEKREYYNLDELWDNNA